MIIQGGKRMSSMISALTKRPGEPLGCVEEEI